MKPGRWLGLSLLVAFPLASTAGALPAGEQALLDGVALYFENDAFNLRYKSDRNYTGGGALRFSGAWVDRAHLTLPLDALDFFFAVDQLRSRLFEQRGELLVGYSVTFGVTAFTPNDLREPAPIYDDRPYGSLDFLTVNRTFASEQAQLALTTELTVGMLGLDTAHQVQAGIHRALRQLHGCQDDTSCSNPDPKGWGNQISNGGEPTARYAVSLEKLLSQQRSPWIGYDLKLTTLAELGYYTAASLGGALRIGLLNSPFWAYNTAPLSGYSQAAIGKSRRPDLRPELYLWGGARARFVAYNALLQGQFRPSVVAFDGTRIERFLYEYEAGLTLSLAGFSAIWGTVVGRSPEFNPGTVRHHVWTSFRLSWQG